MPTGRGIVMSTIMPMRIHTSMKKPYIMAMTIPMMATIMITRSPTKITRRTPQPARCMRSSGVSSRKTTLWRAKSALGSAGREILAVNLVSLPGSGKMTFSSAPPRRTDEVPLFVIEGDQASSNDGERIRNAGAPVVQINTGTGCHLDAEMIARGLSELKPGPGSIVFIENVGNLVRPALFDLGERARGSRDLFSDRRRGQAVEISHMFGTAKLIILNKTDLLPHLDFSVKQAIANVRRVNPNAMMLQISARTGEGLDAWFAWIRGLDCGSLVFCICLTEVRYSSRAMQASRRAYFAAVCRSTLAFLRWHMASRPSLLAARI